MVALSTDETPAKLLLDKHKQHTSPYKVTFKGISLLLHPEVFNPTYTNVSGFFADNFFVEKGETALEMFSGSGALSFLAARKAKSVVGIDISPNAVKCAVINAKELGIDNKVTFRQGNMWEVVASDEKFDVIFGNPPLLPIKAKTLLEMSIADSPEMKLTQQFIKGAVNHLEIEGRMYMSASNISSDYSFIKKIANSVNFAVKVKAKLDVGYERYSILEFRSNSEA